jgi:hypothetical protein
MVFKGDLIYGEAIEVGIAGFDGLRKRSLAGAYVLLISDR